MVTFAIPGENDAGEGNAFTPRSRAPLPFAKRGFSTSTSSPYAGTPAKRLGTPHSSSTRTLFGNRDDLPASGLNKSSIGVARNIFRASAITGSPPSTAFSPSIPQNTPRKVFAPGATPNPTRTFRESTAQATPRGVAKATDKELFSMRISSPDPELSGEALSQKVPKDWNAKGSIYADQFLAHLCPPEFDDEQRRQFFCILDLRRLKYAADEIFSKKDWKLNVINFAKEFEKSRSIILLRYGLYEFQNVKPSKEVLKRWRREHGLPEPADEEDAATPPKVTSFKKRKAADHGSKDAESSASGKRRALDKEKEKEQESTPAPASNKSKRKLSVSDESTPQPSKLSKSTSASAALFGQIAEKHSMTPAASPVKAATASSDATPSAPSLFSSQKPANGNNLRRSVFNNIKSSQAQSQAPSSASGANIFGYLSDASSAKNSGVDADAESSDDSDDEDSPEAGNSDEPSVAASGGAETSSQIGSGLFGQPAASKTSPGPGSAPGTRESTPGRSLFDRISKDSDGQPARADMSETPKAPADQTWNPSSTPIKFAPSAPASSAAPVSSIFAPKSTTPANNLFGAPKRDESAKTVAQGTDDSKDQGGESDKENDTASGKNQSEPKPSTTQPSFGGSSLFAPKPAGQSSTPAPASNIFGSSKPDASSQPPTASTLFGAPAKSAEAAPAAAPAIKSTTLFGAPSTATPAAEPSTTPSLFGASKPSTGGNLFGAPSGAAATPAPSTLFGAASGSAQTQPEAAKPAGSLFSFGGDKPRETPSLQSGAKLLFGAPKSPPSDKPANSMFDGSPMKQDEPSPAKKQFGSGAGASATPLFSFGGASSQPSTNLFGAKPAATPTPPAAPANGAGGGFNFNFGGAAQPAASVGGAATGQSGSIFNNPFSAGGGDNAGSGSAPAAPTFNFGGSSAPAAGGGSMFQFGNTSTPPAFGGGQTNTPAPMFGGGNNGTPAFNLTAAPSQAPQNNGSIFNSAPAAPVFGNLQAPPGGTSTTGTNSPFSFGGGSSLATTPAGGTPEPSAQPAAAKGGEDEEEGEKHEQINLTEGMEADEDVLHDVRAKVLKFVPPQKDDEGDKPKSKSPWTTQGVGPLRLLKHKETNKVRLLLRAEPRGHIAINRSLLPSEDYKAKEKYVTVVTGNETGDGLETYMIQVKTKELAAALAASLEEHKACNKK